MKWGSINHVACVIASENPAARRFHAFDRDGKHLGRVQWESTRAGLGWVGRAGRHVTDHFSDANVAVGELIEWHLINRELDASGFDRRAARR